MALKDGIPNTCQVHALAVHLLHHGDNKLLEKALPVKIGKLIHNKWPWRGQKGAFEEPVLQLTILSPEMLATFWQPFGKASAKIIQLALSRPLHGVRQGLIPCHKSLVDGAHLFDPIRAKLPLAKSRLHNRPWENKTTLLFLVTWEDIKTESTLGRLRIPSRGLDSSEECLAYW